MKKNMQGKRLERGGIGSWNIIARGGDSEGAKCTLGKFNA